MVHPIIVRVSGWAAYFQPTMWEPRGLLFGEIDTCGPACPHLFKVFILKGGSSVGEGWLSNSCDARSGITYRLRPAQKWSNTMIHTCGNIYSSLLDGNEQLQIVLSMNFTCQEIDAVEQCLEVENCLLVVCVYRRQHLLSSLWQTKATWKGGHLDVWRWWCGTSTWKHREGVRILLAGLSQHLCKLIFLYVRTPNFWKQINMAYYITWNVETSPFKRTSLGWNSSKGSTHPARNICKWTRQEVSKLKLSLWPSTQTHMTLQETTTRTYEVWKGWLTP